MPDNPPRLTTEARELLRTIDRATHLDHPARLVNVGEGRDSYLVRDFAGTTPSPVRTWAPAVVGEVIIGGWAAWVAPTDPGVERVDWRVRLTQAGLEALR